MAKTDVYTYDMQYYLEFANGEGYDEPIQVTEDKEFTPERDATEYETSYLCSKVQRKRVVSVKDTYTFSIDAVGPGGIQQKLAAIEDTPNVSARLIRTCAYDFEKGAAADATALPAKRTPVTVNMNPMDGAVGELCTFGGTAVQDGEDWEKGTFNPSTGVFTPTATA
jgi:hypothetical protein